MCVYIRPKRLVFIDNLILIVLVFLLLQWSQLVNESKKKEKKKLTSEIMRFYFRKSGILTRSGKIQLMTSISFNILLTVNANSQSH